MFDTTIHGYRYNSSILYFLESLLQLYRDLLLYYAGISDISRLIKVYIEIYRRLFKHSII